MKKFFLFLGYNLFAVILLFLLSEIIVRIFCHKIQPQGTDKNIFADSLYYDSSGLKPLSSGKSNGALVQVDRYGFRETSTEIDTTKSSWLILGDSVTMGIGVESDSTFAGLLQAFVDSVNILNPSIIGYNIVDYTNVYKYFVIDHNNSLKIKRALVFWCLNDIYNDVPDIMTPGGKIRYIFSDLLMFVRMHSRLYFLLKTMLFDRPKSYFMFDEKFYRPENEVFQNTIQRIVGLSNLCKTKNIDLDIILMPYEYQLRKPNSENFIPQQLMMNTLNPLGIKVHDPSGDAVKSNLDKQRFLYGDGIHLSNWGHRYITHFVLENVIRN